MRHAMLCISSYGRDALVNWIKQFPSDDEDIDFFIHIDGNTYRDNVMVEEMQSINPHVKLVAHWNNCPRWSANLGYVSIWLMMRAMSFDTYDYFHIMSESDYLIKPIDLYKKKFADNCEKSFMSYIQHIKILINGNIDGTFYHGYQWMSLYRDLVTKIIEKNNLEKYSMYIKLFENDKIKISNGDGAFDEIILQTIILRDIFENNQEEIEKYIINDNLTYVNWINAETNGGHPIILKESDYENPENPLKYDKEYIIKNAFVARKIDWNDEDSRKFVENQLKIYK